MVQVKQRWWSYMKSHNFYKQVNTLHQKDTACLWTMWHNFMKYLMKNPFKYSWIQIRKCYHVFKYNKTTDRKLNFQNKEWILFSGLLLSGILSELKHCRQLTFFLIMLLTFLVRPIVSISTCFSQRIWRNK